MKYLIKGLILFYAIVIITILAIYYPKIKTEYTSWNQENNCISTLISKKVERINIVRDNGTCHKSLSK